MKITRIVRSSSPLAAVAFAVLIAAVTHFPQTDPRSRVVVTDTTAKTASTTPSSVLPVLRSKISIVLANPSIQRGSVGVKIMSLDTGDVVYERDAEKYFMPASNMKSFTIAAFLDKLGPDHRIVTSVYGTSKPDSDGVLAGDLIIFGRGDPSFSWRFFSGDRVAALDALADKIIAAGVRKITGNVVGDDSYFNTSPIPVGWEWDDLQWYYGAEVSALSVNDNVSFLKVSPGSVGTAPSVAFDPPSSLFRVVNTARTVKAGERKTFRITKRLGDNTFEVAGDLPANDAGFSGQIAFSKPAAVFADLLKQRLVLKGVVITGTATGVSREERGGEALKTDELVELVTHQSPPYAVIAENTMKPSQNLYTELLLRSLGELTGDPGSRRTSEEKGLAQVKEILKKAGVDPTSVVQYDASGLSRHNLITPNASMMLFKYMDTAKYSAFWKNALTIGGVDGTLRRRFQKTTAAANVRGKTGTIDQVSALSGYVTSKAGERFVFSILTNGIPDPGTRVATIDEIVLLISDLENKTSETAANSPLSLKP